MVDSTTLNTLRDRPMTDDRDLTRFVTALLERAVEPRAWLLFIDSAGCMTDVMMPIDGLSGDPTETVAMPASGAVSAADLLATRVSQIVDETPAGAVVVVWERPGGPGRSSDLRRWSEPMRAAFAHQPDGLRAQFVLADDGAHLVSEPQVRAA